MKTNIEILVGGVLGASLTLTAIYWLHPESMSQLINTLLP